MSTTVHETPPTGAATTPFPGTASANPARRGPVLLATDGASASGAAVSAARLVAHRIGVAVEVVSVLEPQLAYGATLGGAPIYLPELDEARRETRLTNVRDYLSRYAPGIAPPIHVRFGAIAEQVADVARERDATCIVIGAAPHHRVHHIVGGERAVHVLRSSNVPVLSVPPGFSALPQRILVGVDFSPASVRAAETALMFLTEGGTLTLLHVMSPLLSDMRIRSVAGHDPAGAVQTLFDRLREEIRTFVPAGVTVETEVRTDLDVDGILRGAAEVDADLIAVGTHGPRLLERIFIGSVASSVLHTAAQAVLAVPPPPAAAALEMWRRLAQTATSATPREWAPALDAFSRRNTGRRVAIEVDDPELGAQMLGHGALVGVTYDPHDQRIEIMVGDAHRARRHVMHSIARVESIAMTTEERSGNEVLELRHGGGHTLVLVGSNR